MKARKSLKKNGSEPVQAAPAKNAVPVRPFAPQPQTEKVAEPIRSHEETQQRQEQQRLAGRGLMGMAGAAGGTSPLPHNGSMQMKGGMESPATQREPKPCPAVVGRIGLRRQQGLRPNGPLATVGMVQRLEVREGPLADRPSRACGVPVQRAEVEQPNRTGLPDGLKSGLENLSGESLDDVKVHYNSQQPAQVNALAYTQGTEIHVGPGQEKHLPHEGWHVVQQMRGIVQPTKTVEGVEINDSQVLEHEADRMGANAAQRGKQLPKQGPTKGSGVDATSADSVQRMPVIQLQERQVADKSNLRKIGDESKKISIKKDEKVEIITPVETLRFELGLFSVTKGKGPWHVKVRYKGTEYWIKNSHLGESDKSAFTLREEALEESLNQLLDPELQEEDISSNVNLLKNPNKQQTLLEPETTSKLLNQITNEPSSLGGSEVKSGVDLVGTYFNPKVAPIKGKNKLPGGAVNVEERLKNWKVTPKGGCLTNHIGKNITGGGAWVLGGTLNDPVLKGSQAFTETFEFYKYKNMESHQMANEQSPLWAGDMQVKDGKVVYINNQSGTFHLTPDCNANILTYLLQNKVITQNQIDNRTLVIEAWIQTGMDREGDLKAWQRFRSKPVKTLDKKLGVQLLDEVEITNEDVTNELEDKIEKKQEDFSEFGQDEDLDEPLFAMDDDEDDNYDE